MTAFPFRRALVVANPIAGSGLGRTRSEELARRLDWAGAAVELFTTTGRGDARERVARLARDVDLVVSVGGDGTLAEVLSGLPRRDVSVGVLPLGTANVLGRDLGLPRDAGRAFDVIRAAHVQPLDTARVGDRISFLGASAGFDAAVVREFERRRRGTASRLTWVPAALSVFRAWQAPALEVEVDGARVPGTFGMVLVANVVNYAGWPSLAADRVLDDGRFEAYLFPARTRAELLRHAARGILARFPGGGVRRVQGRRFAVRADRPVPYQVDGDLAGETPFQLEVQAEPFRVLAPPIR